MNGISSITQIQKSVNIKCFKSMLIKLFSLQERSLFSIHDPTGVKLLIRLQLNFSHLNKHNFRHNFKDNVVTMCDCGTEIEKQNTFSCIAPFLKLKDKNSLIMYTKNTSHHNI